MPPHFEEVGRALHVNHRLKIKMKKIISAYNNLADVCKLKKAILATDQLKLLTKEIHLKVINSSSSLLTLQELQS